MCTNFKRNRPTLISKSAPVSQAEALKPLTKSKLGHEFVSTNKSISYSTVREYFKSSIKDIVPDISDFSTHSLRADGASAAPNAGVGDRVFQRRGRWKSVSAKNGCINDNLESRLSVSQRLDI